MNRTKGIIIAMVCAAGLLTGCMDGRLAGKMALADSLLAAGQPDSAKTLLRRLDSWTWTLSSNGKMRYYYLVARSHYALGETPLAMRNFHQASDCADTASASCDLKTLARVHGQLARLFLEQDAARNALDEMNIIDEIARKANDTLMVMANFSQRANAYEALNMPDSAILIRQEASRRYKECGNKQYAAWALGSIIDELLDRGDYQLAKTYMDEYEQHSGMFDENGEIYEGYEVYYYDKSLYHLAVHQLDSAEYYARKTLMGKRLNDQEAGCKALYLIYKERGQQDSLAKYAMLAYAYNDSVYRELSTDTYQRMHALYNYTRQQQLAEQSEREANRLRLWLVAAVGVMLAILYGYRQTRNRKRALEYDYAQLQQKKMELEELMQKDKEQRAVEIGERSDTINALESNIKQTKTFKTLNDLDSALKAADITHTLKAKAKAEAHVTAEEWLLLRKLIGENLPNFVPFIQEKQPNISETDLKLCMLVRTGFTTGQMAPLLHVTPSAVSKIKAKLLPLLFKKKKGGAREFEIEILRMH